MEKRRKRGGKDERSCLTTVVSLYYHGASNGVVQQADNGALFHGVSDLLMRRQTSKPDMVLYDMMVMI